MATLLEATSGKTKFTMFTILRLGRCSLSSYKALAASRNPSLESHNLSVFKVGPGPELEVAV